MISGARVWAVFGGGLALVAAMAVMAHGAAAPAAKGEVGIVSHIKVLSEKVEDVSSLEDWKKTYIKPGMKDEEKALAIWRTVVKYRHQCAPPNEFLSNEGNVHDVMKTIHVYGYGQCCCASADVEELGRYIGMDARGWSITQHSVPELFYGNKWHLIDGSLMDYFRSPDGSLAGVEEIAQAVKDWHEKNPGYRGADTKLRDFAQKGNWRKNGPPLIATCETYTEDGPNLAGWHGWSSTMCEYDGKHGVYEYGYSQGYQLNLQLRPGEKLTRNWFNKGLHVNMDGGEAPGPMKGRDGLAQQAKLGDIAPGRIGNGTLEYDVPLADGAFRGGALAAENLATKAEGAKEAAVTVKDAAKPGVLVLRMPSSYVYLGGELNFKAVVGSGGGVTVSFSDNNGLDWKPVVAATASGEQKADLKPLVYRRYDYRLKFELKGAGTGLDAVKISNDIQHSQAPLPALAAGPNKIAVGAGPQEGTITVEGSTNPGSAGKQVMAEAFHPELKNVKAENLRVQEGPDGGTVTFPIETPGDLARVRFGGFYRARDAKEGWTYQVSFDGGKTFKDVGKAMGPAAGCCKYVTAEDVPAGCRKVLVRYQGSAVRNTLCLFDFRIDADYKEPAGGFRPVKVTYVWEEGGQEKKDVHVAKTAADAYTITCGKDPLMKSIVLELAE